MLDQITLKSIPATVENRLARLRRSQTFFLAAATLAALALGGYMLLFEPNPAIIGWIVFLMGAAVIIYRPRYGIYQILIYAMIGDTNLILWWPFTVNFSSNWSLLYLNRALIFSPLEIYLALTFISWAVHTALREDMHVFIGRLFWPTLAFLGFLILGLFYGFRSGGDRVVGLWEARPLFYLVAMIFLSGNLITRREHIHVLIWLTMIGIVFPGIAGIYAFFVTLKGDLAGIRSVALHATAIHMNTLLVLVLASWLYKASRAKRFILPILALPVLFTYFITQRRAAFLSLFIALALIAIILFLENRRLFMLIVPPALLFALAYTLVFWNNSGTLGEPVKALKSVVAPSQVDAADASSSYYRVLENANLSYTLHQKPLFGVGFGQPFYVIYQMPDISFFDWWQYFSHNSIIWIWLKMGVGGFLVMLFLVGSSIMMGTETFRKIKPDEKDLKAVFLTLFLYLVMHFIYAYVDISWDARSMVYVGAAMGIINRFHQMGFAPLPAKPARWPWQNKAALTENKSP